MADTLTRTVDGTEIPAPGTYEIDPTHTSINFSIRHLGLSKVRGSFDAVAGTVAIAEDPSASSVDVTIEAGSLNTGNADRDGHVKSGDFLDVDNHPNLTYRTTGVRSDGSSWIVDGELSVKDVTRPVALEVDFEGAGQDPWGNGRIAFTASTEINREDFGITWNQALETGGVLVGKSLKVDFDVQAVAVG